MISSSGRRVSPAGVVWRRPREASRIPAPSITQPAFVPGILAIVGNTSFDVVHSRRALLPFTVRYFDRFGRRKASRIGMQISG